MKINAYTQRDKIQVLDLPAHVFTKKERTQRSLVRLFSFLGLAAVSILVPVFHFVLVPLFLLLAPFLAYKTSKEEVLLPASTLTCPECQKNISLPKLSGEWPLHSTCPECMNRIYFNTVN